MASSSSILCCFDCKSTKNLRAIHNYTGSWIRCRVVVSTAKVQKIWEQFTTKLVKMVHTILLFRLQKYKKFESNSQLNKIVHEFLRRCFDCKSTKNLRAIHNWMVVKLAQCPVVSTAKVQKIWEQFTTIYIYIYKRRWLFRLQKYKKFESNSQLHMLLRVLLCVVSTAKVQKIWEQFTTAAVRQG